MMKFFKLPLEYVPSSFTLECILPEYFFTSLVIFYCLDTASDIFDVRVVRVGDRLKGGE